MDKDLSSDLTSDWPVNVPVKRCGTSITLNASPERLVGLGFRCWVRGVQTNDTRFFDVCSRQYIQAFGLKDGLVLSTKLGSWVNALDKISKRPIKIEKIVTPGFSYDEVVAISMIAACQHSECPALKACVYAITEAAEIDLPQLAAQDFADGLVDAGQILQINSIAQPLTHLAAEPTHFPN
ncbi:MAG: hypothetical protein DHS20C07_28330 [Methyloligella sp.]|nr:MAG: hypothetical protein DHS20C07_28330 [Methyloligella sp.]